MSDQNFPFICSNIRAAPAYGVYIYISVDTIFQIDRYGIYVKIDHGYVPLVVKLHGPFLIYDL